MRYRYSHLQRLHPCQRTMENSVVGHNNGIWQTARFRQSHRNMRIVRSRSFQMIGNGGMRIEHKNLFPKLVAQGFNCANLIRVSSNEHETFRISSSRINHGRDCNIDIRPLFFKFHNSRHSISGFGTRFAFFVQKRKPNLVFIIEPFTYLNLVNRRKCLKIDLLSLNCRDVVWIGTDAGSEKFDSRNLMVGTEKRSYERFKIKPLPAGIVFEKPVVKIIPIYINYRLFHYLKKMQGAFAFRVKPLRRIGRASRVVSNPSRGSTHIVSNPKSANKGYTEISR